MLIKFFSAEKFVFIGSYLSIFANIFVVRIVEHNDWVVFTLLLCGFAYILMFIFLLRDIRLKEFLFQEYADSSNNFLVWTTTFTIYTVLISTLISQYVPSVPKILTNNFFGDYELNKFGFTFFSIFTFHFLRALFSYLFYVSIGNSRKWNIFCFTATKFYFALSLLLIPIIFTHYYYNINRGKALHVYAVFFTFVYSFKILFYFFHKNQILPTKWYYKFLYICTLQIAPLFAIWRLLFF